MKQFILIGALVAVAYIAGRFQGPERVEYRDKEVIVYKERVEAEKKKKQNRVVKKSEVRLPDGTVTVETIITQNSESDTSLKKDSVLSAEKESEKIEVNRRGAIANVMIGVDPFNLPKGFDAGANLNIPLMGPLYFGPWVFVRPDFKVGVQAGWGF